MDRIAVFASLITIALCNGCSSHDFDNRIETGHMGLVSGTVVQRLSSGDDNNEPDTEPVVGAVCTLEGTNRSASTNDIGYFRILAVADGSYILICRSQNGMGADVATLQVVEVRDGTATDLGIIVATRPGSLSGFAFLQGQEQHRGIRVAVPGTSLVGVTDDAGAFTVESMPEGTYDITLSADGYLDVDINGIEIFAQTTTQIEPVTLALSTGPSGTIRINDGAEISLDRSVTITITAGEAAVRMMLSSLPSFAGAEWQPVASVVPWTFSSDGLKTLYARFSDANGLDSAPVEDSIIIDTLPPTDASVLINNGADLVSSGTVALALSASDDGAGVSDMQVSNEPTFADATWQPLATSLAWTLFPGDGVRTVYARFRDAAGHMSEEIASDNIEVDSSAPIVGAIWFAEGDLTQSANVTLLASATNARQMLISMNESFSDPIVQNYATSTSLWLTTTPAEDGEYTVWVKFVDAAGNQSEATSASIILDTTPPCQPCSMNGSSPTRRPFLSRSQPPAPMPIPTSTSSPSPVKTPTGRRRPKAAKTVTMGSGSICPMRRTPPSTSCSPRGTPLATWPKMVSARSPWHRSPSPSIAKPPKSMITTLCSFAR